ncbi:MAG: hypothetical protein ACT4PT_04050 [Methanobacteriota archaeon]
MLLLADRVLLKLRFQPQAARELASGLGTDVSDVVVVNDAFGEPPAFFVKRAPILFGP